jgi:hypothetical protein
MVNEANWQAFIAVVQYSTVQIQDSRLRVDTMAWHGMAWHGMVWMVVCGETSVRFHSMKQFE